MPSIGPGYKPPSPFTKLGQQPLTALNPPPAATPGVTPPPQQPGYDQTGGYGGYQAPQVDYSALLQSLLAPLQAEAAGMSKADAAALRAAQQRAVIQFGSSLEGADPGLVGAGFGKAIDQRTLGLAQKNTAAGLSISSRLGTAHQDAVNQIRNTLAARGLLRSGETGYQLGREQTAYTQSQYDSRQKILDYLAGIQSAFQTAEQQRQWALAMQAAQSAQSMPFYPPPQPVYGPPPPGYQQPQAPQPQQASNPLISAGLQRLAGGGPGLLR